MFVLFGGNCICCNSFFVGFFMVLLLISGDMVILMVVFWLIVFFILFIVNIGVMFNSGLFGVNIIMLVWVMVVNIFWLV